MRHNIEPRNFRDYPIKREGLLWSVLKLVGAIIRTILKLTDDNSSLERRD